MNIYKSLHTFTTTSTENAVTANNQVEGECLLHNAFNKHRGAMTRKAHTVKARKCLLRDGLRAALNDINMGETILCKKCSKAVIKRHRLRHKRTKRLSGDNEVKPVCKANI